MTSNQAHHMGTDVEQPDGTVACATLMARHMALAWVVMQSWQLLLPNDTAAA